MISNKFKYLIVFTISILFLAQAFSLAEGDEKNKSRLNKPTEQVTRAFLDINSISTQFFNNGISDIDPNGNSGFVFPKGSGKTAVFTSGLLWGGLVVGDPVPRVGGTAYRTGLQPGVILANGQADDPDLDKYRIYRVRPDVFPGGPSVDLSGEAANEIISVSELLAKYLLDWTEWPAELGAPYFDGNGNGVYDPVPDPVDSLRDIPGVPGADQTIWFVANDMDAAKTNNLYGAQPIGLEVQATFWAYSQTGALGNTYFRKYKFINKGFQANTVENMYVSMWSDVDLGDAGDDFVGVDTVLSLQYSYNASATDQTYNPLPPPAVGFDFFQGPLVVGVAGEDKNKNGIEDIIDFGIFDGKRVGPGLINLPMTAAYYFANGDPNIGDPPQGDIQGSTEFYNFFRGRFGISGVPFTDLITGAITTYALNGDPQTRSGWLDGIQLPPGDRRQGSASGPFTLAPGDTQEVVVAEMIAGAIPGVDRIAAIGLLKFYDAQAQVAYDNFFDLPVAPPAPFVAIWNDDKTELVAGATEMDGEIILDWSKDFAKVTATEMFDEKGYVFQGYNIYQLPSAFSSVTEGVRVATFDMIDGIGKIDDFVFDPGTGSVIKVPVQFGNDTGAKRFFSTKTDAINTTPLINGIKYYFAVTAYNYNPNPNAVPNNLENPISIITVIPHKNNPGVTFGDDTGTGLDVPHVEGTADGSVTVTVIDPSATTGQDYEVTFSTQQQIRNQTGNWVPASTVLRKFNPNDPDTLTGTTIDIAAIYAGDGSNIDLLFHLDVVHHYYGWADGVTLTFPVGTRIVAVPPFEVGGSDGVPEPVEIIGNIVKLGITDNSQTQGGHFHEGGEDWIVRVDPTTYTTPLSVDWEVHDDGYAGGQNELGTTIVADSIGFAARLGRLWNLVSGGSMVLENQSVYNGTDLYPPRDDSPTNLGVLAAPNADGIQVNVDVGWDAPLNTFSKTIVSPFGTILSGAAEATDDRIRISNYTVFGGTISSKVIDNFGVGTNELLQLQQDYELRFTGVYDAGTIINGVTVHQVVSGGQWATVFRMVSGAALATNPLNPNFGTAEPFLIKIPFEVWNVDDPENEYQVNLTFRDRLRDGTEDPFWAWNPENRMYACIVNSPYDSAQVIQVDGGPDEFNELATWVLVFWGTVYGGPVTATEFDVVSIVYANPIVAGSDRWTFSTTAAAYSQALASNQVGDINVFPNPYYGVNSEELNKYNRFVTFTHLPERAKIRIFNLAGVLVKTIEKDDPDQFTRWDLNNESNLPVASGLYIAHIELPDLGTSKVLKVAIIQEEQILDRF